MSELIQEVSESIRIMPMPLVRLMCSYHKYSCCELVDACVADDMETVIAILASVNEAKEESKHCPLHKLLPVSRHNHKQRSDRLAKLMPENGTRALFPWMREVEFDFISHAAYTCGLHNRAPILLKLGDHFSKKKLQFALFGCAIGNHYYYHLGEFKRSEIKSKRLKILDRHITSNNHLNIPKLLIDDSSHIIKRSGSRRFAFLDMSDMILFLAYMNYNDVFAQSWNVNIEGHLSSVGNRFPLLCTYVVNGEDEKALTLMTVLQSTSNQNLKGALTEFGEKYECGDVKWNVKRIINKFFG